MEKTDLTLPNELIEFPLPSSIVRAFSQLVIDKIFNFIEYKSY